MIDVCFTVEGSKIESKTEDGDRSSGSGGSGDLNWRAAATDKGRGSKAGKRKAGKGATDMDAAADGDRAEEDAAEKVHCDMT